MIALIDADLVAYRCAASANEEPLDVSITRCDSLMRQLLQETNAEQYKAFLSTSSNFRKEVNPEYKANRKDQIPPQWLQQCKEFLLTEWNAKVKEYYEADDLLGIAQSEVFEYEEHETVIVSLDKDLRMIPGNHYSWEISGTTAAGTQWVKAAEFKTITKEEGLRNFYTQMVVGDATDNVRGIAGLGPVKAAKYLSSCETEQDLFDAVYNKYDDPERFLMNAQCLWIMRNEGETWAHRANGLILDECMTELKNAAIIHITSLLNIMD